MLKNIYKTAVNRDIVRKAFVFVHVYMFFSLILSLRFLFLCKINLILVPTQINLHVTKNLEFEPYF